MTHLSSICGVMSWSIYQHGWRWQPPSIGCLCAHGDIIALILARNMCHSPKVVMFWGCTIFWHDVIIERACQHATLARNRSHSRSLEISEKPISRWFNQSFILVHITIIASFHKSFLSNYYKRKISITTIQIWGDKKIMIQVKGLIISIKPFHHEFTIIFRNPSWHFLHHAWHLFSLKPKCREKLFSATQLFFIYSII